MAEIHGKNYSSENRSKLVLQRKKAEEISCFYEKIVAELKQVINLHTFVTAFFTLLIFISMAIYVGNLAYSMSEQELSDVFAEYGNVSSAKIIKDRYTGRSKGYGFVELENEQDEDKAVEALDGTEVSGRNLKVNKARQRTEGEQRPSGGGNRDRGNDGDQGGFNRDY